MCAQNLTTERGSPYPLGSTPDKKGVNFALFSKNATAITLCLFDENEQEVHQLKIKNRTGDVWHIYVKGLKVGQYYAYRVDGVWEPEKGLLFNKSKLLLDPYAKLLTRDIQIHQSQCAYDDKNNQKETTDSAPFTPKCIVVDVESLKKNLKSLSPCIPWNKTIIYEAHLKGFTKQNSKIPTALQGKFLAMAKPCVCDYLQKLGITDLELLPIASWANPLFLQERELSNYWGYDPICFMAPQTSYLSQKDLFEIQKMVAALHSAGIEVILDVVYNHTGEAGKNGPSICFKGIDNISYYRLLPEDKSQYVNDTGCGNMLNFDTPAVLNLVIDSMRYWVEVFGIDGFRFDLATTLGRTGEGGFSCEAPFFRAIRQDEVLKGVKLIAEPWDLGWGGYCLDQFPYPFAEWNDHFRDACRRFWRGDLGQVWPLFCEFTSYGKEQKNTWRKVNFLTAHDGFTGFDLVSYNEKHNDRNKERNQDGNNTNWSWNSGTEGHTQNTEIIDLRLRRLKSMLTTLLLSNATPMILSGDELLHTQFGNNNAYAQDTKLSWIDWQKKTIYQKQMQKFVCSVLKLRKKLKLFDGKTRISLKNLSNMPLSENEIPQGLRAFAIHIQKQKENYFIVMNAESEDIPLQLKKNKNYECLFTTTNDIQIIIQKKKIPAWSVAVLKGDFL